jgi:YVTN family beta-propeller protein
VIRPGFVSPVPAWEEFLLKRFILLHAVALCAPGVGLRCGPSLVKPALEEEGEVYVYFQPLPQEAERLKFTLDHLSLVSVDGGEFPLSLSLDDFSSSSARRQRFVATGRVPPGRYRGLSYGVKKATLRGDEGETVLLVPEGPVTADFSFEIRRKQAVVLSLVLRYAESVRSGFSFSPVFSVYVPAAPPSGLLGYVTNRGDNTITVFDKKSGEVRGMIATGRGPEAVALDQKAGRAYAALSGEDVIDVLDVATGRFVNTIRLNVGDGPAWLALTPDGRTLLAVNAVSRTLSFIDPQALAELARIPLGDGPRFVLIDRTGLRCYVFNVVSGTISVVDIAHRALVATLSTDPGPTMGQFNRKGDKLFVIHEWGPYLSVIDPFSLSVAQRVYVGPTLRNQGRRHNDMIYDQKDAVQIEVYDPFTLVAGAYIEAMSDVRYMTIDGDENNLVLLSAENKKLMTLNLISRKISAETDVGENPTWLTMMGER